MKTIKPTTVTIYKNCKITTTPNGGGFTSLAYNDCGKLVAATFSTPLDTQDSITKAKLKIDGHKTDAQLLFESKYSDQVKY